MLRRLTDNTTAMFWTLHLGGWAGFALFTYLMGIAAHDKPPDYIMPSIGYALAGTGITYGLRRLYKWIWNLPKIASFFVGGLGVVIAAFAFAAARQFVYLHLYEGFKFGTLSAAEYFHPWDTTLSLYLIGTWSGLYFGIKYYRMVQQQRAVPCLTMQVSRQICCLMCVMPRLPSKVSIYPEPMSQFCTLMHCSNRNRMLY